MFKREVFLKEKLAGCQPTDLRIYYSGGIVSAHMSKDNRRFSHGAVTSLMPEYEIEVGEKETVVVLKGTLKVRFLHKNAPADEPRFDERWTKVHTGETVVFEAGTGVILACDQEEPVEFWCEYGDAPTNSE
ncbi:MAG: hypothetical protein WC480_00610 [Patescibacteria group bacterium]